jgi:phage gp37-like protein
MIDLSSIEQAIKDAISGLGRTYLNEIKTYGGEFDEDKEFAQVVRKLPAVWVTFSGAGAPTPKGAKRWHVPLTFVVLVGARSLRNEESGRHGVKIGGLLVDVGTFQLIQDVTFALVGQDFDLDISHFSPGKISTIFNTKTGGEALSVLAMEWHTYAYITTPDREGDAADWLERVNVDYLFKPDDDVADVSDLVVLQP